MEPKALPQDKNDQYRFEIEGGSKRRDGLDNSEPGFILPTKTGRPDPRIAKPTTQLEKYREKNGLSSNGPTGGVYGAFKYMYAQQSLLKARALERVEDEGTTEEGSLNLAKYSLQGPSILDGVYNAGREVRDNQ